MAKYLWHWLARAWRLAISNDTSDMVLAEVSTADAPTRTKNGFEIRGHEVRAALSMMSFAAAGKRSADDSKETQVEYWLFSRNSADDSNDPRFDAFLKLSRRVSDCISIDDIRSLGFSSSVSRVAPWLYLLLHSPVTAKRILTKGDAIILSDPIVATIDLLDHIANAPLKVQHDPLAAILCGQEILLKSTDAFQLLEKLLAAEGDWLTSAEIELPRPGRARGTLPQELQALVESNRAKGFRISLRTLAKLCQK